MLIRGIYAFSTPRLYAHRIGIDDVDKFAKMDSNSELLNMI